MIISSVVNTVIGKSGEDAAPIAAPSNAIVPDQGALGEMMK
jgi:hypothetical protein